MRQTSIKTYEELKEEGKLGERQEIVYEALKVYEPCTARELHQAMVEEGNQEAMLEGPNYVKPRLTELKNMNLVKEIGRKVCNVSGRTAQELSIR